MAVTRQLDPAHADATRRVLADLKKMSSDEAKETFVRSGIITEDGQLTEAYKPAEPKAPRARRSKR